MTDELDGAYKLHDKMRMKTRRVLELLRREGCISVSALMRELSIGHSQAYHLMRILVSLGKGVKLVIGDTAILCRDRAHGGYMWGQYGYRATYSSNV
jgi:hypothetical protein